MLKDFYHTNVLTVIIVVYGHAGFTSFAMRNIYICSATLKFFHLDAWTKSRIYWTKTKSTPI